MADELMDTDPGQARELLREARSLTGAALSDLRDLVRGIHPPVLAERGLEGGIRALALAVPVQVDVTLDLGDSRLPQPLEAAAYFAVAEALTNVVKHSGASAAWVRARRTAGLLTIEVGDDGRGGAGPRIVRDRAGRDEPQAERVRRHSPRIQPARRAYPGHHGDAVRAVIAEDLALLRDGLVRLLTAHGISVAEAVPDGTSLLDALLKHRPDIAIVDVRLPPTFTSEGLRAAIEAREQLPGLPVLVLSQYVEPLYARDLLSDRAGAIGYLLKDRVMDPAQFVAAVRQVAAGGTVMDPEVIAELLGAARYRQATGPAHPPRAGSARTDGRRTVQRCRGGFPGGDREGGQQAHRQHLHEAGPAAVRRRQPPGDGRTRLPQLLTRPGYRPRAARSTPGPDCRSMIQRGSASDRQG